MQRRRRSDHLAKGRRRRALDGPFGPRAASALTALFFASLAQCSFPDYSFAPGPGGGAGAGGAAGEGGAAGGGASGIGGGAGAAGGGASGAGGQGGGGGGGGGAAGGLPAPGTVIAAGQRNVGRMVIEEQILFWVVTGTEAQGFADGKVLACPTEGCPPSGPALIADRQGKPEFLDVADANYVFLLGDNEEKYIYWTNSGTGEVMRCLKTGCGAGGPTPLAAGQGAPAGVRVSASLPIDFVAGEGGGEAVVVWADAASGDVLSCPADGCGGATPTTLATGRARPRHLVSGNRFFYWIEEGVGGQGGQLFKYEKGAGKAPVPQSDPLATPTRFTLAKDKLFAVDRGTAADQYADGKIVWADPTTDERDVFVDGQKSLFSVAADDAGGNVYWNADGNLMYCRFDRRCVGGAKLLAAGVGQGDIASDGAYVFFAVGDEIRKVPRP